MRWPIERIHVIDCDLGKSGSSTTAREDFQQLVSEVALGKAGIVMGLEVSHATRLTGTASSSCAR
ncbi:DNA invertase Pin-like site-specific DNA recombinase [Bradyrhizobium sp. USDA 326]